MYSIALIAAVGITLVSAWDISLHIDQEASNGIGGEVLESQPVISIFNKSGTKKYSGIVGRVVASLVSSSSYHQEILGFASAEGCTTIGFEDGVSVDLNDSEVHFSGLCINRAGLGYSIRYLFFDEFDILLGDGLQSNISIEVGQPYKIGVVQAPERVQGGVAWELNPIVSVQDKGQNIVTGIGEGNVTIELATNAISETIVFDIEQEVEFDEIYRVISPSIMEWHNGIAEFRGISIKTAGYQYRLLFSTDFDLPGGNTCISSEITVDVGPPHSLSVIEEPTLGPVYGAKIFVHQPIVHIIDAGNNIVDTDSSSTVTVFLYSNPTNAILQPIDMTMTRAENGIARFNELSIAKAGEGYRFQYSLWSGFSDSIHKSEHSNITALGLFFNVNVGKAEALKVLREPVSSWAGNQPFKVQPKVALVDAGGNTLSEVSNVDFETIVVQSLSQSSHIIVDTKNDDIPMVERIEYSSTIVEDGLDAYSNGHSIFIHVMFSQEVFVSFDQDREQDSAIRPWLKLNVLDEDGLHGRAYLQEPFHLDRAYDDLIFVYEVDVNSEQSMVDVLDSEALESNDYIIKDALERNASLVLPIFDASKTLAGSKTFAIHSQPALIVQIGAIIEDGIYGAGQDVDFVAHFTHEVAVKGTPLLPLQIKSSIVIVDTASLGTSLSTSYFYIWYKGEKSDSVPWDASSSFVKATIQNLENVRGSVCVSRSLSLLSKEVGGFRWAIRFEDIKDDLKGNFSTEQAAVVRQQKAIDLQLTFVVRDKPFHDWEQNDGETTMCTVRSAQYVNGTGSKYLSFRFRSMPGDEAAPLTIPLPVTIGTSSGSDKITNAINNGAPSNIAAGLGWEYAISNNILIETQQPQIINIVIDSTASVDNIIYVGDTVSFNFEFDMPVIILGAPELRLISVRNSGACATFDTQPTSNHAIFTYSVLEGHWSNNLDFSDGVNLYFHENATNLVLRKSTFSITPANLALPSDILSSLSSFVVDGKSPRITTIQYADDQDETVGLGDTLNLDIYFSSPVIILKGAPILAMTAGSSYSEASYDSGNQTAILQFKYTVAAGDHSSSGLRIKMLCVESGCLEGSSREGTILQDSANPSANADLRLPLPQFGSALSDFILDSSVVIDTTDIRQTFVIATSIWHHEGIVAVGEVIRILVDFSDRVYCQGRPQIKLNTESGAFFESGSGTKQLTFVMYTTLADVIDVLNWVSDENGSAVICQNSYYEKCSIVNGNDDAVNLSFEDENAVPKIAALAPSVQISSMQPKVIAIHADVYEPKYCNVGIGCKYTAGDSIVLFASFDLAVSVEGFPRIRLTSFDSTDENIFAVYDVDASNDRNLAFIYNVKFGDTSKAIPLSYHHAKIWLDEDSSIKRKSTFPIIETELVLPDPTNHSLRNIANFSIVVDADYIPSVRRLVFGNETGTYSPGDRIVLSVEFDHAVQVQGVPVVVLDVGGGLFGCAFYSSGSSSKYIAFEYIVDRTHCSTQIEYVNKYALYVSSVIKCQNQAGSIKRASENPTIDASLVLPDPGTEGSLSSHSLLNLDCRVPYITKLWSPQSPRKFFTNDIVSIMLDFSREVVVIGSPLMRLETGNIDRTATFYSQPGGKTLEFQYIVKLGDSSPHLDYWVNEGTNRTSTSSVALNGGFIMVPATHPSLHADLHINPSFGYLDGIKRNIAIIEGEVEYRGLKIGKRGSDYKLRLGASIGNANLETEIKISIGESCEFELNGDENDRDYHDKFGASVALRGDLIAVGAPQKKVPTAEVQVVKVWSKVTEVQREVQLITTHVNIDKAIRMVQQFQTFAAEGEAVEGYFSLWYKDSDNDYAYAVPVVLRADVDQNFMRQKLVESFPILGDIEISRDPNTECNCMNGWIWKVIHLDASRGTNVLITDGMNLKGLGSKISAAEVISATSELNGSFKLHNPFNDVSSRDIAFNATAMVMKSIIEEDLAINVHSIQAANLDSRDIPELGRRWTITYSSHEGAYGTDVNVPNLATDPSLLSGANATVWTHVGSERKSPLSGTMSFSFRGSSFSPYISHDCSEEEMRQTLEALESINEVTVTGRTRLPLVYGYAWTVIFNSVNMLTEYGWVQDPGASSTRGNLSPLEIEGRFIGWNPEALVEVETGSGLNDMQAQWMTKDMGDDGTGAGQVSIYRRSPAGWEIEGIISASDRSVNDHFGKSLSFGEDFVVVGASNKEVHGFPEQQTVTCSDIPSGGTFTIRFRGFDSDPILFDANLDDIHKSIQGVYGSTKKLHSIPRLTLKTNGQWSDSSEGFCSNIDNSFTITFWTPDGGGTSTVAGVAGDIEMIEIDQTNLIGGSIEVAESRKGSRTLSGSSLLSPVGIKSGVVYVYERRKACDFCPHLWYEAQKLSLLDCFQEPQGSEEFGSSVAVQNNTIFIGAPGFQKEAGKVFTFYVDKEMNWKCGNSLSSLAWGIRPGDRFGHSLGVNSEDTVLVGAPGNSTSTGSVSVFRRHPISQQILSSEQIVMPTIGVLFGFAVSISGNEAVICAPHKADKDTEKKGACFIYKRISDSHNFDMKQTLIASNVKKNDRFGWTAAISKGKVLVGQIEEYKSKLEPQAPVQIVTTKCGLPKCLKLINGSFRLGWRDGLFITNSISHSVSAKQLGQIIQDELHTGTVHVTRTESSDKNGGFQWSITFMSLGNYLNDENTIPKLSCESKVSTGTIHVCTVEHFSHMYKNIRSKAHLFTSKGHEWIEQAFLFPAAPQSEDHFGISIALEGDFAVVGAPNRQLLNVNSGAAMVHDLSFSNFYFDNTLYNITEGRTLEIPVLKKDPSMNHILGIKSLDINANSDLQCYLRALWSPPKDEQFTTIEMLTGNSALTNDQFYGGMDNRSMWVKGMFDYRGINDYQAIDDQTMVTSVVETVILKTTDDDIFEAPDEQLTIQVSLPGMYASPLGHLRADVTILDNGDGIIENATYYSKLPSFLQTSENMFGSAIAALPNENFVVVGNEVVNKNRGIAHLYLFQNGKWNHLSDILPPRPLVEGSYFGNSVSISRIIDSTAINILVGEPGQATVHIFVYDIASGLLLYQSELKPFDEPLASSEYNFGIRGSVHIETDLTFVGCSKLEAVFVYRRVYDTAVSSFSWVPWTKLQNMDFDFDVYSQIKHVHKQGFGMRIALSQRQLVISAPYSDYGNRGDSSMRENFNTDGLYNIGLGKGKVYIFHSRPHILKITCTMDHLPFEGTFKLSILHEDYRTAEISWNATQGDIKTKLEALPSIGNVSVSINSSFDDHLKILIYSWTFSLLTNYQDEAPKLVPIWYGNNCNECTPFTGTNNSMMDVEISINEISSLSIFTETYVLQGHDVNSGDCFGCSVDISYDQVIVGAPFSSAKTRTTWDFETGLLVGWFATGNAFDYQPTYGDNSRRRMVYKGVERDESLTSGEPQASRAQGRYYIGTYEKRPGNTTDYLFPDNDYCEGNIQGDTPMGTLTSDPFFIQGDFISFLIGGGCDHLTEYVELIVDGFATIRATGQCAESMNLAQWDVSAHRGRVAQIRIVDKSSSHWGHLNVDDIQFSWNQHGDTGGAIPKHDSSREKQHYSGVEESAMSGAAYVFKQRCKDWLATQLAECDWIQEQRLVPSDKRAKNLFGMSVSIDSEEGAVTVGSPNSPAYGFLKENPELLVTIPVDFGEKHFMKSGKMFMATPGNLMPLVENSTKYLPVILPRYYTEKAGALYTFQRHSNAKSNFFVNSLMKTWSISEHGRIAPPDVKGNVLFASVLSPTKSSIFVGTNSGTALFLFRMGWQHVRFSSTEYVAAEGTDFYVQIEVVRDQSDNTLHIGYSTSDLTATGVDEMKMSHCIQQNFEDRKGCGDYEQTSGILYFASGQKVARFKVRIMNDGCLEHAEYVQLNLSIPGAAAIQGEQFRAQLRIDDDDWNGDLCPNGIS